MTEDEVAFGTKIIAAAAEVNRLEIERLRQER
jgi:hypothetical protein